MGTGFGVQGLGNREKGVGKRAMSIVDILMKSKFKLLYTALVILSIRMIQ